MSTSILTRPERLASEYDVVVIGSGAAGLVAAVRAADAGLSVLVVEKAALLGGTTAAGGGVMWAPNNHLAKAAGTRTAMPTALPTFQRRPAT